MLCYSSESKFQVVVFMDMVKRFKNIGFFFLAPGSLLLGSEIRHIVKLHVTLNMYRYLALSGSYLDLDLDLALALALLLLAISIWSWPGQECIICLVH